MTTAQNSDSREGRLVFTFQMRIEGKKCQTGLIHHEAFLFFKKKKLIYLAALGISCVTQQLWFQHAGYCSLDQELNAGPLHWERGRLVARDRHRSPSRHDAFKRPGQYVHAGAGMT